MTTRNILILSIVFAEILFLGFSSTYELPALDADEMKGAVTTSVIQRKQELDLYKQLKLEEEQCQIGEERLDSLEHEGFNVECYRSGSIIIASPDEDSYWYYNSNNSVYASCGSYYPRQGEYNIFSFPEEEKRIYSNWEKYERAKYESEKTTQNDR